MEPAESAPIHPFCIDPMLWTRATVRDQNCNMLTCRPESTAAHSEMLVEENIWTKNGQKMCWQKYMILERLNGCNKDYC